MKVSDRDLVVAKALVDVLNKANFDLKGSEAIVVGRVMEWSAELIKRFDIALKQPESTAGVTDPQTTILESQKKNKKVK